MPTIAMTTSRASQRGVTLLTSLIVLVVLTALGIAVMNTAALEERMSGGWQDRKRAYQAAEMALRDAEAYLVANVTGLTNFKPGCNAGLCYNGAAGYAANTPNGMANPVWTSPGLFDDAARTIDYGEITGAAAIEGVDAQPRYIIEGYRKQTPGQGDSYYYRITVRATGARSGTVVMLQEVFRL
ncbi:MAG: PilX N-terminal domain-containing pilus assembly protein [Thiobacillaceae bacterium]|jgi:type IV pilus assembly protein PilX|nr:PilX N-terminal domain-containing pilus assembly protein [Thiobacillaceae bacterium]